MAWKNGRGFGEDCLATDLEVLRVPPADHAVDPAGSIRPVESRLGLLHRYGHRGGRALDGILAQPFRKRFPTVRVGTADPVVQFPARIVPSFLIPLPAQE